MTTLSRELAQQKRWKLKPQYANLRMFDVLLENEFRPPAELAAWQSGALRSFVRLAATHTPYYASLFAGLGLNAEDFDGPEDLEKLPVLHKHHLLDFQDELTSRWLPPGEQVTGPTKSSGTTGRPASVIYTHSSSAMFGILRHRGARWFELDPAGSRLDIRPRSNIFHQAGDPLDPDKAILRSPSWFALGEYFHTGPEFAFNSTIPMETQVDWVKLLRPNYPSTFPGIFAEWVLVNEGRVPTDSLRGLIGIGAQMTPSLRLYLERNYRIPVDQIYGLNEIGNVAVRCSEGRYHVNIEHCLVEITDDEGRACAPGETGHLLATGYRNMAMPLIRYDTGDLAEVASGPCPCGRTLPSFAEISGRHRNYAGLPKGSRERLYAIRAAVDKGSPDELIFLRRYQLYQDRNNRFELRLVTAGPIPEPFRQAIFRAWDAVAITPPAPLAIVAVDEIPIPTHGKPIDFISEFHTDSSLPLGQGTQQAEAAP